MPFRGSSLDELLFQYPAIAVLVWIAAYISDYYLTVKSARLYALVKDHIVYEGSFELTPFYQSDIDRLRRISPRLLLMIALNVCLFTALWYAARELQLYQAFALAIGSALLSEAAIHVRHLRNLALFRAAARGGVLQGRLAYPRWLILRMSAVELGAFAALYALLSAALQSWFLLGGALSCAGLAGKHRKMAAQARAGQGVAPQQ